MTQKREITLSMSGNTGRSTAMRQWIDQNCDRRLVAISCDGSKIEINYMNFDAESIPGFVEWIERHGVSDYTLSAQYVTFAETSDATLFWLAFQGRSASRFCKMENRGWRETSSFMSEMKQLAITTGSPMVMDHDDGIAVLAVNSTRTSHAEAPPKGVRRG